MPLYDFKCQSETCGVVFEGYVSLQDWPKTLPCDVCGSATVKVMLPKAVAWNPDPVVVFQAKDGTFRYPGDDKGLSVANYERQGFKRIEIRGATDMRRFEKTVNRHEESIAQRKVEKDQEAREAREHSMRSELRHRMQSMSPKVRAVAQATMDRNDRKKSDRGGGPGFHSDVYSNYRSNREESRDTQGRRRRD